MESDSLLALIISFTIIVLVIILIYNYVSIRKIIYIAAIGYPDEGKTTFITTFLSDLGHSRFETVNTLEGRDEISMQKLAKLEKSLIEKHEQVPKTTPNENHPYSEAISVKNSIYIMGFELPVTKEIHIVLRDFAGEFIRGYDTKIQENSDYMLQPAYLKYSNLAHVLFLFIDLSEHYSNPLNYHQERIKQYKNVLENVHQINRRSKRQVCIIYNKSDLLSCSSPEEFECWGKSKIPDTKYMELSITKSKYEKEKAKLDIDYGELIEYCKSKKYPTSSHLYSSFWRINGSDSIGPTITGSEIFDSIKMHSI